MAGGSIPAGTKVLISGRQFECPWPPIGAPLPVMPHPKQYLWSDGESGQPLRNALSPKGTDSSVPPVPNTSGFVLECGSEAAALPKAGAGAPALQGRGALGAPVGCSRSKIGRAEPSPPQGR